MTVTRPVLLRTPAGGIRSPSRVPRWLRAVLGVPLEQKVLGANFVVLASVLGLFVSPVNGGQVRWADMSLLFVALTIAALASYALIRIALRPVKELERIARKVSLGRVSERVPSSLVADPDLAPVFAARRVTSRPLRVDEAPKIAESGVVRRIAGCPIVEPGVAAA